jgi:predicted NAD-dependent protein-ADP-ribosyltransferase YbiA (DUF1768 family)
VRAVLKKGLVVLVPETDEERLALAVWKEGHLSHVLLAGRSRGESLLLHDLGARADVLLEPLNVSSRSAEPAARLISNFALAPFVLDGRPYASVEGFWQGLRFEDEAERRRIAALHGSAAKRAGNDKPWGQSVGYGGQSFGFGTPEHWALMRRACRAKFTQSLEARDALLSTGRRPLQHKMRRDSRSIPGAIMADIWTEIRGELKASDANGRKRRERTPARE